MNWEETILYIRTLPEFKNLVEKAYFDEDLCLNVERFRCSEEFKETLRLLELHSPRNTGRLLDVGAGNGVSSAAFALAGYDVVAVEPDISDTVGAGAIRKIAKHYQLKNLQVHQYFAEKMDFHDNIFDIVYARQSMHHASNLVQFLKETHRVLKPGGLLMTVRDHVVFSKKDKAQFLKAHPLQKYYGGENAYSPAEYRAAMEGSGLRIITELHHFDNVINYFPMRSDEVINYVAIQRKQRYETLCNRLGGFARFKIVQRFYDLYLYLRTGMTLGLNEKQIPGRLYSFICRKP